MIIEISFYFADEEEDELQLNVEVHKDGKYLDEVEYEDNGIAYHTIWNILTNLNLRKDAEETWYIYNIRTSAQRLRMCTKIKEELLKKNWKHQIDNDQIFNKESN